MPTIIPIRDLKNTSAISKLALEIQEPIFVTKNGYSDIVVMSAELYEKFARINKIDLAMYESEKEVEDGVPTVLLEDVKLLMNKKHYG